MFYGRHFLIGFVSVLFILQNNFSLAAKDDTDTAALISQYYCHRLRECRSPAREPVCGYSENTSQLEDFKDECDMFRANCNGNGVVVFYMIEKEICDMKKKYNEAHKGEEFEFEHISRVTSNPSSQPPGFRDLPAQINEPPPKPKSYPPRMKFALEN